MSAKPACGMRRIGARTKICRPPSGPVTSARTTRCCTSIAWVGEALAARILHAEKAWDHEAFFDYMDRWMTEDDTKAVAEIKKARGQDYSADWERQGQTSIVRASDVDQVPPQSAADAATVRFIR